MKQNKKLMKAELSYDKENNKLNLKKLRTFIELQKRDYIN